MAMTQTITKTAADVTAAANNTLKATAVVNGTIDTLVAAIAKAGPLSPGQQSAIAAFKTHTTANAATVRIALYGS